MASIGKKKNGKRTGTVNIDLNKYRLVKGYQLVKRTKPSKKKK